MVEKTHKTDYSKFKPIGYPVRHRAKFPFDPKLSLTLEYRKMLAEIRELDRELDSYVISNNDYKQLVDEAYADNIHWSVRIEGNKLTLDEVKHLTNRYTGMKNMETAPGPRQEIINHLYYFFLKEKFEFPWTMDTITGTHALLMKGVSDDVVPGEIRTEPVGVYGQDGTEYFIACPPEHISEELESLIDWLNGSPYDEVVTSILFFHEFESIHPFRDGNGRIGRTLFQILMQELGLKNCKLCKFEREMLSDFTTYYDLLAFTDSTGVYTQLVMYMTEALLESYRKARDVFASKDLMRGLDENSRLLVLKAKKTSRFSFKEACTWLPGLGEQSVRSRLEELVDKGIIVKIGATRNLRYMFSDPFRDLRAWIEGN